MAEQSKTYCPLITQRIVNGKGSQFNMDNSEVFLDNVNQKWFDSEIMEQLRLTTGVKTHV